MKQIEITQSALGSDKLYNEVVQFFHRHTNRSFHRDNILFQAREEGVLIGLVRLCREENRFILRSMEVKKEFQRMKIGTRLLETFEKYIREHQMLPVYNLPYSHLENFYAQIGFRKIADDELPPFLKLRLEAYRRKRPESRYCAMILE